MRSKILPIILIFLSILLINCKGINEGVQIYNPTDQELKVQINDSNYTIEANTTLDIDLEAGDYPTQSFIGDQMIIDTIIKLTSKVIRGGVLLNLSGEKLYKLDEIYGAPSFTTIMNDIFYIDDSLLPYMHSQANIDEYVDRQFAEYGTTNLNRTTYNSILVKNYIIIGNIDIYEPRHVKLPLDWDYGPDTPYPDEIEVEDNATNNAFGVYKSKLFSASDLIEYYFLTYSYDMEGYEEYDETDFYP